MQTRTFRIGEGKFELEVTFVDSGRGVCVYVGSVPGAAAHVGATAQAIPRPEPGRTATISILAVPCHRDEVPAHDIAGIVATELHVPTAVTCGVHMDNASLDDLKTMVEVSHQAGHEIVRRVRQIQRAHWDDEDEVVTVDADGNVTGAMERVQAHTGEGTLHQAFSVLLIDDGDLVLCRRSVGKRLWGNVLADTCAGHPFEGEDIVEAAGRRLIEEIGATCELEPLGHVVYREDHGDGHCECEWCGIYAGRMPEGVRINGEEISELRRVSLSEIDGYLAGRPEQLAPWVRIALSDEGIRAALEEFASRA